MRIHFESSRLKSIETAKNSRTQDALEYAQQGKFVSALFCSLSFGQKLLLVFVLLLGFARLWHGQGNLETVVVIWTPAVTKDQNGHSRFEVH